MHFFQKYNFYYTALFLLFKKMFIYFIRSVISTSSSGSNTTGNEDGQMTSGFHLGHFYYALYDFKATEATMLQLYRGQVWKKNYLWRKD